MRRHAHPCRKCLYGYSYSCLITLVAKTFLETRVLRNFDCEVAEKPTFGALERTPFGKPSDSSLGGNATALHKQTQDVHNGAIRLYVIENGVSGRNLRNRSEQRIGESPIAMSLG